jgi:hypothetical protein
VEEAAITATFEAAHCDRKTLSKTNRATLDALYQHPLAHNLEWSDVVALFEKVGTVDRKGHVEVAFGIAGEHHRVRKPHAKDLTTDEVMTFRHMLTRAGWLPQAKPEPSVTGGRLTAVALVGLGLMAAATGLPASAAAAVQIAADPARERAEAQALPSRAGVAAHDSFRARMESEVADWRLKMHGFDDPEGAGRQAGGAADLRGDHDLQGHQADGGAAGRVDRHLGGRRARPPGGPVCQGDEPAGLCLRYR